MALLKRGILSGFSGSVANINGFSKYRKECIRLKAPERVDAGTTTQLDNRELFFVVNKFSLTIYYYMLRHMLCYYPGLATPFFKFYKINKVNFDATGLVFGLDLLVSYGNLLPVDDFQLITVSGTGYAQLSWNNNADGLNGFDTDIFYGFVYNRTLKSIQLFNSHPARSAEYIAQQFPAGWLLTHGFWVYVAFYKYNGLDASISNAVEL